MTVKRQKVKNQGHKVMLFLRCKSVINRCQLQT